MKTFSRVRSIRIRGFCRTGRLATKRSTLHRPPSWRSDTSARAIDVNGVRLEYDERGEGAPIVCIHGAGTSAELWADALEKLGRLGRAIAYDRRGYGRSERPDPLEPMSVAQHADDAAALLDAVEAKPAVLIARSYGGEVATDLALRHPEVVRALALLEAAPVELLPASADWTRGLRDRMRKVAARRRRRPRGGADR